VQQDWEVFILVQLAPQPEVKKLQSSDLDGSFGAHVTGAVPET
jgi:hypothetical protein